MHLLDGSNYDPQGPETSEYRRGCEDCGEVRCEGGGACPANQPAEGERLTCDVGGCYRLPIVRQYDELLCERHMADPHTRSWSEMREDGIEVETMSEYQNEVRGFNDFDPPENDPYDEEW